MAEEGAFARGLELFGSEREWFDREGQLEVLGDVEDLLDAVSGRAFEIGDDQEVNVAQLVHIPSRDTAEQKDIARPELSAEPIDQFFGFTKSFLTVRVSRDPRFN